MLFTISGLLIFDVLKFNEKNAPALYQQEINWIKYSCAKLEQIQIYFQQIILLVYLLLSLRILYQKIIARISVNQFFLFKWVHFVQHQYSFHLKFSMHARISKIDK